jgi:glycosyltransferase involved in cell wall biosynthesis
LTASQAGGAAAALRKRCFAIVGTRGIPARYGGFETFAEELSARLVERGYEVAVYCRERHAARQYRGVVLRWLPTIRHKYLDTVVHTLLSTLHLLVHRVDAALYCNAANAIFTWLPRLAGMPVALNVDGIERRRRKWGAAGRAWYRIGERLATVFPNALVTDAESIARYYRERYGARSECIPYGAEVGPVLGTAAVEALHLSPGRYFLYVSRMEPENNALLVREAFERLDTDLKLVLVGDAPYAQDYIARVRDTKDPRVILPGAIYGQGYRELQSHCFAYVHATEVGGTHPALIEAMGRGALTLYLDTPENAEVAQNAAIPFTHANLTERLRDVLNMSEAERSGWRERAMARVRERYSWDRVTDAYERLLLRLVQ